jgi:hypothetical protein
MIRNFEDVRSESTCKKRITVVELYDKNDVLLSRESNRCSPPNGVCSRIGVSQTKSNYDVESTCNWTHAEIMALQALPEGSKPYKSVLYGHSFYCDFCENALRTAGVEVLEVAEEV